MNASVILLILESVMTIRDNQNQLKTFNAPLCILFLVVFVVLMGSCGQGPEGEPAQEVSAFRPNVILIITDDQGYGDLACHGNPHIQTPHLDQLHRESMRFTNFHAGTTCSPTRAALMTGKNCNRVGVWHTIGGRSQLSQREKTMADVFHYNGYRTGMFGKWHLGDSYPFRPHDRGFDEVLYHGGGGVWQMPDFWDNDYFGDTYFTSSGTQKHEGYCTDVWFQEAMEFISEHRESPFFTYIATNAPHGPFHIDSSYIRPYLGLEGVHPNFNGMITNLDENVGKLRRHLDSLSLTDNTILIFMTDNGTARGASFDKDGQLVRGYNAGMKGIKGSEYEGGHRVPCFLSWPAQALSSGTDITTLTAHIDLLPTLIELCDLEDPWELDFDGKSLRSLLFEPRQDKASWENRILITDTQRDEHPVKWKRSCVMMDQWRLINKDQLYDLSNDPGQLVDVSKQYPEIVSSLQVAYEDWWTDIEPTFETYTRAILGSANDSNTLYSHDWHEAHDANGKKTNAPWNQTHIRNGIEVNGFWEIHVEEAGIYNFELRRWPRELDVGIADGIPGKSAVDGGRALPGGRKLPVERAKIRIDDEEHMVNIPPGSNSVNIGIDLNEGDKRLQSWFEGSNGTDLGVYYVYITKIE